MDFRIAHRFACSPEVYWETTRSEEYEASFRGEDVDTEVIEARQQDDVAYERRRVSPRKQVPGVIAKAIGRDRLSYVQEVEADNRAFTTRWKVLSDVLPDKVKCSGTSRVVPHGDGCERIMEGSIEVGVLFVGGTIERHILTELQRGYDRAAEILTRLLPKG